MTMRTTTEDAPLLLLDTVASSVSSSSFVSMMRLRNHKIGKVSSGAAVVVFSLLLFSVLAVTKTEDHQMSGKGRRGLVMLGGGHHTHHNHEGSSSSLTSSVSSEKKQKTRKGTKTLHKQEKPSSTLRLGKKKHKQTHKRE